MFIGNEKIWTTQFKVATLLFNIKRFEEKYGIVCLPHHKQWYDDSFDYPEKEDDVNLCEKVIEQHEKIKRIQERQNLLLQKLLESEEDRNWLENDKSDMEDDNEESALEQDETDKSELEEEEIEISEEEEVEKEGDESEEVETENDNEDQVEKGVDQEETADDVDKEESSEDPTDIQTIADVTGTSAH